LYLLLRPTPASDHNAVWLGIDWGRDVQETERVENLAEILRYNGIDTLYIWTTWLQADGTWSETTFANMSAFLTQLRAAYPDARLYAWIGVPVDTPQYRLDDDVVRGTVATFAGRAIAEFGFDGIHLNAEPVWDGDEYFRALLREVRQVIGAEVPLSVAVPPDWNTGAPGIPVGPLTSPGLAWSVEYKQAVALLADEIAVMAYNSGLGSMQDYQTWMAFQVTQFASAIASLGSNTRLIMGIPTYDAEPPGHDPAVENVPAAISGVRLGIEQLAEQDEGAAGLVQGVGIYAYWSTDLVEWTSYRQLWLRQPDAAGMPPTLTPLPTATPTVTPPPIATAIPTDSK
ncbi:MAG: hypothetical protein JW910_14780, partial [Anaerolineae bacterium]|nr:hypothetical protein [Anaerolineae bacterium]